MGFRASDSQQVTGPSGEYLGTMGIAFTTSPGGKPASEIREELVAQEAEERLATIALAKSGDKKAEEKVRQWGLGHLLIALLAIGGAAAGVMSQNQEPNNNSEPLLANEGQNE